MTTANLRIVPKNDHDDAVLTPSAAEVVGFEVANTQNTRRSSVLRTTSNSGWSFTGVLPATRTVSHFSMWRHLNHAGSMRLQLYSDAGATSGVYDSTAVSCIPYSSRGAYTWSDGSTDPLQSGMPYYLWFTPMACRSYKVTFSGTPGQAYWQVSRFWLGRYFELVRSAAYGTLQVGQQTITDSARTQGGSLQANQWATWRTMTFDLNGIDEADLVSWVDVRQYIGVSKDVVVSAYPGDGDRREAIYTIAGRFSNLNDIGRPSSVMSMHVQIEEN